MPLSEHEQRLLDQLEQQLQSEDPKFASTMDSGSAAGSGARRLILGILAIVAGLIIVLVFGLTMKMTWLGVLGFVVMLAGATWSFIPHRAKPKGGGGGGSPKSGPPRGSGGSDFMTKLEQRWDRRRNSGR